MSLPTTTTTTTTIPASDLHETEPSSPTGSFPFSFAKPVTARRLARAEALRRVSLATAQALNARDRAACKARALTRLASSSASATTESDSLDSDSDCTTAETGGQQKKTRKQRKRALTAAEKEAKRQQKADQKAKRTAERRKGKGEKTRLRG